MSTNQDRMDDSVAIESPPTDEKPKVFISRRSSVFKRRLTFGTSTHEQQRNEDESTQNDKQECQTVDLGLPEPEVDSDVKEIGLTLVEYNAKLKAESQAWSSLRRLRKRKLKMSRLPPEVLMMENIADLLTEEDKAFIAEAPDYERIAEDLKSLVEESVICARIEEKAKTLTMTVVKKLEEQVDQITSDIINYSFVKK